MRVPFRSAQLYAACSAATSGGLVLAAATSPRRTVRRGRILRYKIRIRSAVKQAERKHSAGEGQGAAPILSLRVVLPAGLRYVKSGTSPPIMRYDTQGRKEKLWPVEADGGLLTWENIGATGRDFMVKARVDSTAVPGTLLTFSAQLFELVPVGSSDTPACPQSARNVTMTVI